MVGAAEAVADAVPVGAAAVPEDLAAAATEETGVADSIAPAAVTEGTNGTEITAVVSEEVVTVVNHFRKIVTAERLAAAPAVILKTAARSAGVAEQVAEVVEVIIGNKMVINFKLVKFRKKVLCNIVRERNKRRNGPT